MPTPASQPDTHITSQATANKVCNSLTTNIIRPTPAELTYQLSPSD